MGYGASCKAKCCRNRECCALSASRVDFLGLKTVFLKAVIVGLVPPLPSPSPWLQGRGTTMSEVRQLVTGFSWPRPGPVRGQGLERASREPGTPPSHLGAESSLSGMESGRCSGEQDTLGKPGFPLQPCRSPVLRPWASHTLSLNLCFWPGIISLRSLPALIADLQKLQM